MSYTEIADKLRVSRRSVIYCANSLNQILALWGLFRLVAYESFDMSFVKTLSLFLP
ncbi:hypothetical protein [Acinetobacter lwoffii]|uniref:hypothetical protein n=1 Tax=Acinetobacter lwoffii TaxID=28090 RepID=UPI003BF6876B